MLRLSCCLVLSTILVASEDPYRATWLLRGGISLPDGAARDKSGVPAVQFGITRLFRGYRGVLATPGAEADLRYANGDGGTQASLALGYAERRTIGPRVYGGAAPQLWIHRLSSREDGEVLLAIRPGIRAIAATTVAGGPLRLPPVGIEVFAQTMGSVAGDLTADLGIQLAVGF